MQLVCVLLTVLVALGPARDQPDNPLGLEDPAAQQHFARGMDAWLAEDYDTAKRELEETYAIEPAAELLYSLGQLERLSGDCARAVQRFEAYLRTDPPDEAAEDTRMNIARCEPFIEDEAAVKPETAPTPAIDPPPPTAPTDRPPSRRPDALGISLTAVGGAMTGVGLGLFGGAFARQRSAENESEVAEFERGVQSARTMYWTGVGLAAAGAAIVVGGVVRLLVRKKQRSTSTATPATFRFRSSRR